VEATERSLRDGNGARGPGGGASPSAATAPNTGEQTDRAIVCAACGHTITREGARIVRDGSHEHEFTNPDGLRFRILCFAVAPGTLGAGPSSEVWTWFVGFAWRAALCEGCLVHVGWSYVRGEQSFFGLIRERLVQGVD
jgi:hypothetical protein